MDPTYTNTNTRTDTLNAGAAHDTGIYDPNVHDNQIVAMYETDERARMAHDRLLAEGVPSDAVQIVDKSSYGQFAGGVDYESGNQGIWGAIKSMFMPDEDAHGYAEGVRRGHAMVIVNPSSLSNREHVIHILEQTQPLDFDAKLEEWRQAGYSYPGEQSSSTSQGTSAGMASGPSTYGGTAQMPDNSTAAGTSLGTTSGMAATTAEALGMAGSASSDASMSDRSVTGSGGTADRTTASRASVTPGTSLGTTGNDETLKIVEERLRVGKREVARGAVRVRSYIVERPIEEQVRLHEERVSVERHSVDRPATEADLNAFQEKTIDVVATGEEAVIAKDARVVEEIAVHKQAENRVETVHDTVRHTEVEVNDTRNTGLTKSGTIDQDDTMGTAGTGAGQTTTSTTGATSSGTNAPRK